MKKKYSEEYIQRRVKWYYECWSFIEKADYKSATSLAKKGLKLFPDDTIASFTYFSIMADYALSAKTKKFQKMHADAVKGMKGLLKRTSGRGISTNFKKTMKNEYFYQTKQFKKQYYLGVDAFKRDGNKFHLYSSGVGAANYALELARKNKKSLADMWAKKSVTAWETYFEVDSKYYNPYVHYGLAWGILGEQSKMMKALKASSKRCKKPMSYKEFAEVIDWVNEIPYWKN